MTRVTVQLHGYNQCLQVLPIVKLHEVKGTVRVKQQSPCRTGQKVVSREFLFSNRFMPKYPINDAIRRIKIRAVKIYQ
jgi:hypothetical protein